MIEDVIVNEDMTYDDILEMSEEINVPVEEIVRMYEAHI